MPIVVVGLKEAQKAMRALQPTLDKELKKELKNLLNPIVKKAQGYVPMTIHGLSNWTDESKVGKITAKTSIFRIGHFPLYNPMEVKRGIKSELFPTKPNRQGFVSLVRIVNKSAAGAIYETAGRKNPNGQPWNRKSGSHDFSHSRNPNAGKHFINSLPRTIQGQKPFNGRLIFRAWKEDQGRALGHIMKALEATAIKTVKYVDAAKAFRKAA